MMQPRTVRRILWMALALVVPVPFFLAQTGLVPAARLLMLGAVTVAIIAAEGSRGVVGTAAALLFAQGALYLGLFWLASHLLARVLGRLPERVRDLVVILVVVGICCAGAFRIYRDPFAAHALHTNAVHVFE